MKFLRGKVWQIVLALCMLVVLLCITASAESQTATISFAGESVSVGGSEQAEKFFFTNEGKLVKSLEGTSASDQNYHVKLKIENDEVNLYLNGATITYGETGYAMQVVSTSVLTVNVIVEKDSTIQNSSKNGLSFGSYDAVLYGPGKLTVNATNLGIAIGKSLTVAKNGNLEASAEGNYTVWGAADTTLNVNGGKASFSGGKTATLGVTNVGVSNKANVTIAGVWPTSATNISVENSRLEMTGSSGCISNKDTRMKLTFTKADPDYYVVKTGTNKETATDYKGEMNYVPFGNEAGQFSRFSKYVLIAPKFELTVEDQEKTTTKVIMGEEVTVSATGVTESVAFDRWTVESPKEGFVLPKPTDATTTFTMPASNVSIKAEYETEATILLGELSPEQCTFSNITPKYFTTDSSTGAVTPIETPADGTTYNIKLAFEKDVPTVFLKNATITTTQTGIKNAANTPEFVIKTEAASTISQTDNVVDSNGKYSAVNVTGQVTFKGSALLTLKGRENAFYGNSSAKIIFEGANVNLEKTEGIDWGEAAISGSVSEITFAGGTVNIESSYMGLFSNPANGMTVTAKQNTIVDVNCVNAFSWYQTKLIVDNSRLNIASGNNYYLLNNEDSTVAVENGGELELETSGDKGLLANAPDLRNYQGEYYAVMGASKETAEEYTAVEGVLPNITGKYFRIGKKATVNVTNGTVKGPYAAEADDEATVIVGDTVTLSTDNTDGTFIKWTVDGENSENSGTFGDSNTASTTFTVLVSEVNITAEHGKKVSLTAFSGRTLEVVEGGPAIYYKVNATNDNVSKITEGEYNIKFVYPKGGTPTLTLNGVKLEANGEINAAIGDLVIEVLGENSLAGGITTTDTNLTICTPEGQETGSLELSSGSSHTLHSKKTADSFTVTLENVNMTIEGSGSGTFRLQGAEKLHVKGGSLTITANEVNGIYCDEAGTEVVLEETQATIITGSDKIGLFNSSGTIKIKDSNVKIGSANAAIRIALVSVQMEINNSTVEAFTTARVYSGTPNLVGDYFAVAGANSNSATQYTGTALSTDQTYFKIVPAFKLTVTDGKADFTVGNVTVNNATEAPAGVSVTVNPSDAEDGKGFAYWTSAELLGKDKNYDSAYTFTMPQKAVTVAANYGAVAQVTIDNGPEGTEALVKAVKGGATRYYSATMSENRVVVVEEVDQKNANIVFVYPDDENNKPQLTLNGVELNGYRIHCKADTPELTIDVQGVNEITNDGIVLLFYGTDLEFVGNGQLKLNATAKNAAIAMMGSNNSLTLNGGTIIASAPAASYCVAANAAEVNVNSGSTLVVVAKDEKNASTGIYGTNELVINGGTVQIPCAKIGLHIPLEVQSGSLEIGNTVRIGNEDIAGAVETGFANTINISGGYVEVNAGAVSSRTNNVTIGENCVAVWAPNKDVFIENPEGYAYTAGRDTTGMGYFLVEPKVVEVTITWGAMSFTYTGSIWNVETLKWEGRWEPTVSDDSEAAGMDGYDSALASNQIKVVNSGTVTVNVSFSFNPNANVGNGYTTVDGAFKATSVTRKPYYLSNWDEVDSSAYPNLYAKAYFWADRKDAVVTVSYNGKTEIADMAEELKRVFDQYPDNSNMRIINITAVERQFLSEQTEDCVFMEKGVEALAKWVDEFLEAYESIGGKLDAIYSDLEYNDGYAWYLYSDHYLKGETEVFYNITQHPSYLAKIRPELEKRGFEFYSTPANASDADKREKCELYTLVGSSSANEKSRYTWDAVVRDLLCDYLDEAIYKPLHEHYPNAYFTDYQSRDSYGWMKLMNENACNTYRGGNTQKAGTHSSYNAYNYAPQWVTTKSETDTSYKKPVSYNGAVFEDNAFHMTQWETNNFKSMYAATDSKKIEITLTYYDFAIKMYEKWRNNQDATSSGTPYHIEGYLHAGLLDPEFGGFITKTAVENEKYHSQYSYNQVLQIVSNIMKTLDAVVGYSDRKPIETPLNWNDSFILSGMYANGRNVWRITPDTVTGVSDKGRFLDSAEGGQIVFKNKGQTITFPQGSIIGEPIPTLSTCGYWVETPADVMPIVTNDADRYEEYPAYVETFDNYTVDQDFNSQYSHTWESVLQSGASASIQENAGDKVLAIQGNATLNNIKLPEYITAGDNYAKQQAWELSFRLSALPSGNGELKLLTASSGANTDGGFCIMGDKLYFGPAGDYMVFENVTLEANTEYTLKRVLNFLDSEALSCSYYVYDAEGNLLDKAENIAMPSLKLPVQKIGISTADFGTNTLYVDDYKLYATGVTTDLEVYNAETGILVDDPTAMQNFDTAYRLSWMNASDATKYYNVVATYSDDTKEIMNSIEMLPGCDGVNTGIVKLADGKSVTISLEETTTKVPDAGDNAGDDGSSNGSNSASGEDTTITLPRFREADVYLYLSSGAVASFPSGTTLGTVTITIDAVTPAQGGNA